MIFQGTITPIERSILFAAKFPDQIIDKNQLQRERKKMPKKAIVASSRGKRIHLALPGPIKQSQSGYESESSAQQPAQKST
ncbi:hypothetical protein PIB30_069625 [Stylosanthes scabra]|uniref:Uncharacterized protein n=1 Tax=Stylosanthes scabra TaxID=79078 RepID=A0ABU6YKT6_9FABA|nr:hypothetical protein [Stylosanthes scabra]